MVCCFQTYLPLVLVVPLLGCVCAACVPAASIAPALCPASATSAAAVISVVLIARPTAAGVSAGGVTESTARVRIITTAAYSVAVVVSAELLWRREAYKNHP